MQNYYTCKCCKQQFLDTWYVEAGGYKFCSHRCHIMYCVRNPDDKGADPLPKDHDGCLGD